jgi:hypothetical protein
MIRGSGAAASILAGAMISAALASPAWAQNDGLSLRLPKEDRIVYRGAVSFDQAGMGSGSFLYPAPNAAGMLAAIITHGALAGSARESQKSKLEADADRVLSPYEAVLTSYTQRELAQRAVKKMATQGNKRLLELSDKPGADRLIEGVSVFYMTQDQSALVLDSIVAIHVPGGTSPAYQNTIRVVSNPKGAENLAEFWNADQGEALKDQSAILLAEALDLALRAVLPEGPGEAAPFKTHRYLEGKSEKMERGQLFSEHCNRMVIKNLRGWLMSVPVKQSAGGASLCGEQSSMQQEAKQ